MAADLSHSEGHREDILPAAVGAGLGGWLRMTSGVALLAMVGSGWLGLLTWDGAVVDAAGGQGPVRMLTATCRFLADLMLQGLGLGALVLLAVPTFLAIDLLARMPVRRPWRRAGAWAAATVAATGLGASLPLPQAWPFGSGLGGAFGEVVLATVQRGAYGLVGSWAAAVASVLLTTLLVWSFWVSTSLGRPSVQAALRTLRRREPILEAQSEPEVVSDVAPGETPASSDVTLAAEPVDELPEIDPAHPQMEAANVGTAAAAGPEEPIHVPFDDLGSDEESERMARRFAPPGSAKAARPAAPREDKDDRLPSHAVPVWRDWRSFLERTGSSEAEDKVPEALPAAPPPQSQPQRDEAATAPVRAAQEAGSSRPAAPLPTPEATSRDAAANAFTPAGKALPYQLPSPSLLPGGQQGPSGQSGDALLPRAKRLEAVLADFGVRGIITAVRPGPVFTCFEVETAAGTRLSRVVGLASDIAKGMGADTARIAPTTARQSVAIELPNERRALVDLRDLIESGEFRRSIHTLPLAMGELVDRQPVVVDLARLPGVFVTGASDASTLNGLRTMLMSLLFRCSPEQCRLLLVDLKSTGLQAFEGIGHLLAPVIARPDLALGALTWCVREMEERRRLLSRLKMRSLDAYANAVRNAERQGTVFKRVVQTGFHKVTGRPVFEDEVIEPRPMPYVVLVIQELDELLRLAGPEAADLIIRLCRQGGKDVGVHVIAASARLGEHVLAPVERAGLSLRACFKLRSKVESRAVLGDSGAELLLDQGDMLLTLNGQLVRAQAPVLSEQAANGVIDAIRAQGLPVHEPAIAPIAPAYRAAAPDPAASLYDRAKALAIEERVSTIAQLRVRLGVGPDVAAQLLNRLIQEGVVAEATAPAPGPVGTPSPSGKAGRSATPATRVQSA